MSSTPEPRTGRPLLDRPSRSAGSPPDPDRPSIVWFRRDLRLADNPAWARATAAHSQVVALFVLEPELLAAAGPHRRRQLLHHLHSLHRSLQADGGGLTVRSGPAAVAVVDVARAVDASALYFNADYSAFARRRDDAVIQAVDDTSAVVEVFHGNVVHEPGTVLTKSGRLSQVFSPFHRRWQQTPMAPWPTDGDAETLEVSSVDLPAPDGGEPYQPGGEAAAWDRLNDWLDQVDQYPDTHDFPGIEGTSRLSADLRFGTLAARAVLDVVGSHSPGRGAFVRQLAWRDWWAHTLEERPDLPYRALRPDYDHIGWRVDPDELEAWKEGRTGYPLVDAGMRQLARTGWMHNRVRMVTASFLVKDLLIDWREGERHFRRLLVDGEPAQNGGNWQWVAGTGPDAAPYFRIFNPTSQSRKFDPDGSYIRRWVPELAALDDRAIHEPSKLGPLELAAAGITLGDTYPEPIVDHKAARERTLTAYKKALG